MLVLLVSQKWHPRLMSAACDEDALKFMPSSWGWWAWQSGNLPWCSWTCVEDGPRSDDSTGAASITMGFPSGGALGASISSSSDDDSTSVYLLEPMYLTIPINRRVTSPKGAGVLIFSSLRIERRKPILNRTREIYGPAKSAPISKYWLWWWR